MKLFRLIEFAYLAIAVFFLYQMYVEWSQQGGRIILYGFLAVGAIFMFFFKRSFRKKIEANHKDN